MPYSRYKPVLTRFFEWGRMFFKRHPLDIVTLSWLIFVWFMSSLGDMPSGTDTPVHFFKAWQTYQFFQEGVWPNWSFLTQAGAPFLLTYPPLYYFIVASLTLLGIDLGFSMKIVSLLTLIGLFSSFWALQKSISGEHSQIALAMFSFSMTLMYSLVGQHPFSLAVLFAVLSILCYVYALPNFSLPFGFSDDLKRVLSLILLTPLCFTLTILTHLVAGYMLGLFWLLVLIYQLVKYFYRKDTWWNLVTSIHVIISGILLSAVWFFPALLEYTYQAQYKVTILQQLFQESFILLIALIGISPLLLVLFSSLMKIMRQHGDKQSMEIFLMLAALFFLLLALGKFSPFFFLPLFDSLLPGRVLVFFIISTSLLSVSKLRSESLAVLLLFIFSLASLIYYLNPSVLGRLGIETWQNTAVVDMADDETLYGYIPSDFEVVLDQLKEIDDGTRVVFLCYYATYSPLMQHYRLLFLSDHSTIQGDYPDSSEDTKWVGFTEIVDTPAYYYNVYHNITDYLVLGNVGWIIVRQRENYGFPHNLKEHFFLQSVSGEYELWKSRKTQTEVHGDNGYINATVERDPYQGKIVVTITSSNCTSFVLSETYHPRWRAWDQKNQTINITRDTLGFLRLSWNNSQGTITLQFEPNPSSPPAMVITIVTLMILVATLNVWFYRFRVKKIKGKMD
ncbi:MAG: hypothetical protein JSV04_14525 [Candidatus Heimdallarchaeota archaeon]|nr:MAG: hypothetical protein JSV04_14525 [Candidatus Heimdallarchaeota archaeon]